MTLLFVSFAAAAAAKSLQSF